MVLMRHVTEAERIVTENDPAVGVSIATFSHEYSRGSRVPPHAHGSDQLIYASQGVMEVGSGQRLWLIPPHFGLWIPTRTRHQIRMPESVSMRTLYLRPGLFRRWSTCTVFHVGPLVRQLIFEIVGVGRLRARNHAERALRDVLVAQLQKASAVPTGIGLPRDVRANNVAQAVLDTPARRSTLAALCASAGLSVRTVQRAFRREVGMDFETWRRQVRLMKAVELLVAGHSVKEAAFGVGYQESKALVALFRDTFGLTPKAWISSIERL